MQVLAASGHVERFADIMVRDTKTGECIRADHLLEDVMEARSKDSKLSSEEREKVPRTPRSFVALPTPSLSFAPLYDCGFLT